LERRTAGAWRVARREPPPVLRVTTDRLDGSSSARLAAAASEALEQVRPPGAQIAVRRRGTLLWAACAGRADRSAAVMPEDRFVLASATKLGAAPPARPRPSGAPKPRDAPG
jgi:hypothetical protein